MKIDLQCGKRAGFQLILDMALLFLDPVFHQLRLFQVPEVDDQTTFSFSI